MRIGRLELDGFGRFAGAAWDFDEGLAVMVGRNEAGKTTLLNAMRAMLFGFESTRDGRTWYPALAGGRRGGRLTLVRDGGERWTVERHGERGGAGSLRVTAPTGNTGGQETLGRLLGGADRELFGNVFAFGLDELSSLGSLSSDAVRGRIYGAAAGLGATSVLDIERELQREQDELFRPAGRNPILNGLLADLDELGTKIAELERQPAQYEELRGELAELRRRSASLHAERTAALASAERLARLAAARPLAAEMDRLEAELAAGDASLERIGSEAEAEIGRLEAALADAADRLADLDRQVEGLHKARESLHQDERLLDAAAEIAALRDERHDHLARQRERDEAEAAARRHAEALEEVCRRVGGWSEAELMTVDDSIAALEHVREAETRQLAAAEARERSAAQTGRERSALESDEAELEEPIDAAAVTARRSALAELRELDTQAVRLDERERGLAALETYAAGESRGGSTRHPPPWLPPLALALAGAALVLGGGLLPVPSVAGGGAALAGALLLALAAWLGVRAARSPGHLPAHPGQLRVAAERERLDADRGALAARRVELLRAAGLGDDAGPEQTAAAEGELAAAAVRAADRGARAERLAERRQLVARLEAEAVAAAGAHETAAREWDGWRSAHGLADLSPSAARQVIEAARQGRRTAGERDAATGRAEAAAAAVAEHERRISTLLAGVGRPVPADPAALAATVPLLAAELERSLEVRRKRTELERQLAELEPRRPALVASLERRQRELAQALEGYGCPDPDSLRRRVPAAAARRALAASLAEQSHRLAGIAGDDAAALELRQAARAADPPRLAAERVQAEERVEQLAEQEAEAHQRQGAAEAELKRLESSAELGTLRQRQALLEGQAAAAARRWSVLAVALRLLHETRARYERERQPQVIQEAERYFAAVTGGQYLRIVAPPGEASLRVEPAEGPAREPGELSRGTAEQLYLALRFGLIEQFARGGERLPVVMDDILVNFDPERAGRAAAAIRQLAERHQVIYFTCHPSTARLLDPDGRRTLALD